MADRIRVAVFEPPPGNLGDCSMKLVVYEDGGVELRAAHGDPIVLAYPKSEPQSVPNIPGHNFRHLRGEFWSWFDSYAGYPTHIDGPRLCPPHLPVFGVVEESSDG